MIIGNCVMKTRDTWHGAKKDTKENSKWSKDKVNDGAQYIEKKTD